MENETVPAEEQAKDTRAPLLARKDQLMAQYEQHQTAIREQQQRLGQLQVQATRLEGAIALVNDLLNEQPAEPADG